MTNDAPGSDDREAISILTGYRLSLSPGDLEKARTGAAKTLAAALLKALDAAQYDVKGNSVLVVTGTGAASREITMFISSDAKGLRFDAGNIHESCSDSLLDFDPVRLSFVGKNADTSLVQRPGEAPIKQSAVTVAAN